MSELEDVISVTVADILFDVDVEVVGIELAVDRPCLALIKLAYQHEVVHSDDHTAFFCTALCYYNTAVFVDAVRETVSKALMKGEK